MFGNSGLTERVATLTRESDALRRTVEEHASSVLAREATVRECEGVVADREATIRTYAERIMAMDQRLAAGEEELAARQSAIESLERAVAEREAVVRRTELVVGEREAAIRGLETVIQGYEQAMRIMQAAIDSSTSGALAASPSDGSGTVAGAADAQAGAGPVVTTAPRNEARITLDAGAVTPVDVDRALTEWRRVASKYANQGLWGGQTLIDAYLVERVIHDRIGWMIMATIESQLWYENTHGIELPELLRLGMLRRGDIAFDCGANQGLHSVSYAHVVGQSGRVVAFDPFALHIDIGRFNARLNGVDNIDFIQAGVSNRAEHLTVSMVEQCVGSPEESEEAKAISLVPLDSFFALRPSFIKIDIEGAEVNALEGATEILKTEPALYIEIHPQYLPRFNRKPMDVFKHVTFEKYRIYIHYPGIPPMSDYVGQFEITEGCALYCIPHSRLGHMRQLRGSRIGL